MSKPPDPISPLVAAAAARQTTEDPGFQQREAVKRHLDAIWTHDKLCPICGTDDWIVDNIANLPVRSFHDDLLDLGIGSGTPVYPLCPVVCRTCGYTFFVNEKWAHR
jgi:uncharacterized protein CbrC (UPF0167 family)